MVNPGCILDAERSLVDVDVEKASYGSEPDATQIGFKSHFLR